LLQPQPTHTRRVTLLGSFQITDGRHQFTLRGSKMRTLFAWLILHPQRPYSREQLANQLWPDAPPERTLRNLSDLLYRLRQTVGDGWLKVDREHISLRRRDDLWVDVWAFEAAIDAGDTAVLPQTLSLYHGDLLPDLYSDWILQRRLTLREMWLDGLATLGRTAEQQRDYQTAHDAYQQLTQADPLREEACRGLMRTLAGMGQIPAALDSYERLATHLTHELNISPTPQTMQLVSQLRRELELQTAVQQQSHQFIPPFVGRVAERAQLLARLDKAALGEGGIAVVLGEAGMGKTRLLQEVAHSADWRGWQMGWGYGTEFSLPHPYAPLTDALSAAPLAANKRFACAPTAGPHCPAFTRQAAIVCPT